MLCHSLTTKIDGGANLRGGNQAFNIISVAVITTGVVGNGATWGKLKARTKIKKKKNSKIFGILDFLLVLSLPQTASISHYSEP